MKPHRLAVTALLLMASCDDNIWGESAAETVEPPSQTGYAGVQEIVGIHCLGCHDAASSLGGLDLETDLSLNTVNVPGFYGLPIVAEGDPEVSMLYLKITDTQPENTGTDMPPGSGGLGEVITEVVYDWILDGAPPQ